MKFEEWVLIDFDERALDDAMCRLKEETDHAKRTRIERQIQELQSQIERLRKQCP